MRIKDIQKFKDGGSITWEKLSVPQKKQYIAHFLKGKGYDKIRISAIIGNLQQENGTFDTKGTNTSSGAYGIAQWYKTRKNALLKKKGYDNINTQLEHLHEELQGGEHWSNSAGGKNKFFKTNDLKEATYLMRKDFERPGEQEAHDDKRYKYASQVFGIDSKSSYQPPNLSYPQSQTNYSSAPNPNEGYYDKTLYQPMDYSSYQPQQKDMSAFYDMQRLVEEQASSNRLFMEQMNANKESERQQAIKDAEEAKMKDLENRFKQKQAEREQFLSMIPQANSIESDLTPKIMQKGGTVRELYEAKTGKDWSTAKSEGLTDGTYQGNLKLRESLMGETTPKESPLTVDNVDMKSDYSNIKSFGEAFKIARKNMGANSLFTYKGKVYGTNLDSEKLDVNDEQLKKFGIEKRKTEIADQNKQVESVYTSKEVVKVSPEWKDWDDVRNRQAEINKMTNAEKIIEYHKSKKDEPFLIVDKKNSRMHLYKGGSDKEEVSYEVGLGANLGDAQTVTKQIDGKTDWSKGNWSTGAGVYTVSNSQESNASYYGAPSWNLVNENGIEVSTAIHGATPERERRINKEGVSVENNRISNGCVNGRCSDLRLLYNSGLLNKGAKVYILPEDDGNNFEVVDGKLRLIVDNKNRAHYNEYVDSNGEKQKGQGVNIASKTLDYKPIKFQFYEDIPQNAKDMAQELTTRKKDIMKELKINSDVYNDLALLALGIAGQESEYGTHNRYKFKKHLPSVTKMFKFIKEGSTDVSEMSAGMTQIKFDSKNKETKEAFEKFGIKDKDELWDNPNKAITATMILLAKMYNDELKGTKLLKESGMDYTDALMYLYQGKKKDIINKTATPEKNNYINNVRKFSSQFKLKQYM